MTPARIVKQLHGGRCFLQLVSTAQDETAHVVAESQVDVAAVSGLTIEARR